MGEPTRTGPIAREAKRLGLSVWIAIAIFVAAWIFHVAESIDLFLHSVPDLNDDVLHLGLTELAASAWADGSDPTDPWYSTITSGYPLFHHYQHLPHVLLGGLAHLLSGTGVTVLALLRTSQLLAVVLLPIVIAASMWRFGIGIVGGCFAGVGTILITTRGLYGIDPTSFGWSGLGLTTQLFGTIIMAPCWALLAGVVGQRRARNRAVPVTGTGALLAILVLTHTLLAWVTCITGLLLCLPGDYRRLPRRLLRLAAIGGVCVVGSAYFVIPFLLDRAAMNRSIWEAAHKVDGYGFAWTLTALGRGDVFDGTYLARFPVLTILVGAGLLLGGCAWRWPERVPHAEALRNLALLFVAWLLLFCGRAGWGAVADLLPGSGALHFHRLIVPVQLAGLGLAGGAVGIAWQLAARVIADRVATPRARTLITGAVAAVTLLLLVQPFAERHRFYAGRRKSLGVAQQAFLRDGGDIQRLLARLAQLPAGRAYAGRAPNWGRRYTIGEVPVYALVTRSQRDNLGYMYHALSLNADIEGYFDETRPAHYNLFNIRYVVSLRARRFGNVASATGDFGRHRLWRVATSGFFDLVDPAGTFVGSRDEWRAATIAWLRSAAVEKKQHPIFVVDPPAAQEGETPVTGMPIAGMPAAGMQSCAGSLGEERVGPGRYATAVTIDRPCYLLLKVTYHPNWRARVDGAPVPTVMMAPAFVGLPLEPGEHQVELLYRPRPLRRWLRWLGALGIAGLLLGEWRRRLLLRRGTITPAVAP